MNDRWFTIFWYFLAVLIIIAVVFCVFAISGKALDDEKIVYPTIVLPEKEEVVLEPHRIVYESRVSHRQFVFQVRPDILPVDSYDLELLACVIYQEAGCDWISDNTRMMVGNVVLNRVNSDLFPNTIEEVLLQSGQYGEYSWTGIRWLDSAQYEPWAVERAYRCAQRLLEGERVLEDDVIWQAGFIQGYEVAAYSDGIYFCK